MTTSKIELFDNIMESHFITILKSISWRIWGTAISWIVTFYVTGSAEISTSVSILEILTKTFLFYLHERFWLKIGPFYLFLLSKIDISYFKKYV